MYAQVANSLAYTCLLAPEGYYKPPVSLSDNYYICPVGTYSTMGATACTLCPYSTTYGSLSCIYPTSQPSGIPTSQPSPVPTSHPTAYCVAGTIRSNYQCTMASNGKRFGVSVNYIIYSNNFHDQGVSLPLLIQFPRQRAPNLCIMALPFVSPQQVSLIGFIVKKQFQDLFVLCRLCKHCGWWCQ